VQYFLLLGNFSHVLVLRFHLAQNPLQ